MTDSHRTRLLLFGLIVLGLFGALAARLWYLQVLTPETYQIQAQANLIRNEPIPAPRGRILDRNGNVLVDNRVTNVVTIDKFTLDDTLPSESDRKELAVRLAREISQTGRLIKSQAIESAMNDEKYGPFSSIPIATDVSREFSILLGERLDEFPGVDVEPTTVRDYPYATLAAHVLGSVGPINQTELEARELHSKQYSPNDDIGKTGVERSFEDILRGTPGFRQIEVDAFNNVIDVREDIPPIPGNDVVLTIDIDLQAKVERELQLGIEAARTQPITIFDNVDKVRSETGEFFPAPAGAAVMLDPTDGSVLAMASFPTFDPQLFIGGISNSDWELLRDPEAHNPLLNRALQGLYSPGSTFKPFVSYAAFDTGLLGPRGPYDEDAFVRDPGVFIIPKKDCPLQSDDCIFTNAGRKDNGNVNLANAITVSSDVYYYKIGYEFASRRGYDEASIQQAAQLFGLGSASGIALPFEQSGRLPTRESMRALYDADPENFPNGNAWTFGDMINISIGQGDLTSTPLQMAIAYGAIANGGTLLQPKIAEAEVDALTDEVVRRFGTRVVDELYFPDKWRNAILEGLRGVLKSEPVEGTADGEFETFPLDTFPLAAKTGTVEGPGEDSAAFVAFGPLPNPKYVMFTYIEEGGFGATAAAPIVRNVFEAIANDDIDTVPTEQQVEDFLRQFKAEEIVELGLSGDPAIDLVQGFDPENPESLLADDSVDESAPAVDAPAIDETGADPTPAFDENGELITDE